MRGMQLETYVADSTHFHIIIWVCDRIENNNYLDNITLDLIASDPETAIARAKTILPNKKYYSIRSVLEHFDYECRGDK